MLILRHEPRQRDQVTNSCLRCILRCVDANPIRNAWVRGWFTKEPETVPVLNTVLVTKVAIDYTETADMTDLG